MWFIGVKVQQETNAPPPKKILDPPLHKRPPIQNTKIFGVKALQLESLVNDHLL